MILADFYQLDFALQYISCLSFYSAKIFTQLSYVSRSFFGTVCTILGPNSSVLMIVLRKVINDTYHFFNRF
jgi:hypothetical protein